ncbi:iron chaperone [Rathayibacter sp. CAU 1779]
MSENTTTKAAKPRSATKQANSVEFTADERAAIQEYSNELKTSARRGGKATKADGLADLMAQVEKMVEPDRTMALQVHELVMAAVPELTPKTWYGMPAYALNGDTICFFQPANKFKARFSTLGFGDKAKLDDGEMWPIYYSLKELTPAVRDRITELVRRAVA